VWYTGKTAVVFMVWSGAYSSREEWRIKNEGLMQTAWQAHCQHISVNMSHNATLPPTRACDEPMGTMREMSAAVDSLMAL